MTTHTISSYVASYDIVPPVTNLTVTGAGTVGAGGVSAGSSGVYTVANSGHIGITTGSGFGVRLPFGGTVINNAGATISGGSAQGVSIGDNYQGRSLSSFASVVNNGTIQAPDGVGVYLGANALRGIFVTNGATNNTTALINGLTGIYDLSGNRSYLDTTISNFGTIRGTGAATNNAGIIIDTGTPATIVNGGVTDADALITAIPGSMAPFRSSAQTPTSVMGCWWCRISARSRAPAAWRCIFTRPPTG